MNCVDTIIEDISRPFRYLNGSDCSRTGRLLVAILFTLFFVNLWPLFHWQLWALKIEFYHFVIYSLSLVFIGILLSKTSSTGPLADDSDFAEPTLDHTTILAFLCVVHLSAAILLSVFVLDQIPHESDGVFYLFQAKIFSSGNLSLPVPNYGEFLADDHILMNDGRWFTIYTPGWPALLVLGEILGKPWLINPFLSAALVLVVYLCGREMYSKNVGLIAAALATLSPFLVVMGASFYSHTSCALFCAIYLLCVLKAVRTGAYRWYLIAGSCLAVAFLIRTYTAMVFGAPGMIFLLYHLIVKRRPVAISRAVLLTGPIIVAVCVLMAYNLKTTGDPLKLGYSMQFGTLNSPGFGERMDLEKRGDNSVTGEFLPRTMRHTPWRGLMILQSNWASINLSLFGWPIPSLIFLVPWFFFRDRSQSEKIVWASIGGLILGYFLFYYRADRLMTESLPWIIIMSARGIECAHEKVKSQSFGRKRIPMVIALCMLYAVFAFYPLNLIPSLPSRGWLNRDLPELVKEKNINNAVVFIDSKSGEKNGISGFVPHQSYLWNEINPDKGDVIYMRDMGERNVEMRQVEKTRSFWRYSYNGQTKQSELIRLEGI